MSKDKRIHIIVDYFSARPEVLFVYLFGSHARGDDRKESDIDVAVLLGEDAGNSLLLQGGYMEDLRHETGTDVDVAILNSSDVAFAYRVISEGRLLAEKDARVRVTFMTDCIRRYFDLKPTYDQYYQALDRRITSGAFASV